MTQEIFIVEMLRWGRRDLHSYVHGVYSTETLAREVAEVAEQDRGGKYDAEITSMRLDGDRLEKGVFRMVRPLNKPIFAPIPDEHRLAVGDMVVNIDGDIGTVVEIGDDWHDSFQDARVAYTATDKWHPVENLEKYNPKSLDL
jgi:hypothetical protein